MLWLFPFLFTTSSSLTTADCYKQGLLASGTAPSITCIQRCPNGSYTGQYECYSCSGASTIAYSDSVFTITAPQYLQQTNVQFVLGVFTVAGPATVTVTVKANYGHVSISTYTGLTFDNGVTNPTIVPVSVLKFTGALADVNAALSSMTYDPIKYFISGGTYAITSSIDTVLVSFTDGTNYAHIELRVRVDTAGDPSFCECNRKVNNLVCSGHGTCDWQAAPTACTCTTEFTGNNCDKRYCKVCMDGGSSGCDTLTHKCTCVNSVTGDPYYGDRCQYQKCPASCNSNGTCDRNTGLCTCFEGYYGHDCSQVRCINNCSGNGRCVAGTCACYKGFDGLDCSKIFCPRNCGASGGCDYTTGKCKCAGGYGDADCMFINCPSTVPGICNLTGDCDYKTGLCSCYTGYSGVDCSYH